ncbi:MAG: hypothetical protein K9G46_02575 [Flavobacteriales bacterium]|nr:hypothetical protein [Flavobacteriales bacterium]
MKTPRLLQRLLSYTLLLGSVLLLPSCFRCVGVYCENGTCDKGYCDCDPGYYGDACQYQNISSAGYNCVSGSCTYVSENASYLTVNECYSQCGSSCNYDVFTAANCQVGYVPVAANACCPASNPFYCSETGLCYTTCEAADAACSVSTVVMGSTSSGGAGYACDGGSCISVSSGASYSTLSECQSACVNNAFSLNDNWLGADGTGISISGTGGTFYSFGGNWQLMANSGYVSVGSAKLRYISTLTSNTWGCQVLFLQIIDGVPEATAWSSNGTITMSPDGNVISVAGTSPFGSGLATTNYTRQ